MALPVGIPEAFTELVRDPLGDLVARYARTHGPFHAEQVGLRLGLGVAVVNAALDRLRGAGRVMAGEFRPGGQGTEWCDAEVLRTIRRRSLAALRREVEPVSTQTLARFAPAWQGLTARNPARGVAGLARAIEQLAGAPIAASALESMVLPARVADYSPALLDQLTLSGDVVWGGAGAIGSTDGWIVLAPADAAELLLPEAAEITLTPTHEAIAAALDGDQALFFRAAR